MAMDKNGREIKTGDVVRISGAYFKADNGLYAVMNVPGNPDWAGSDICLHKICRDGRLSTAKYTTAFWPLVALSSNRERNALSADWNKEHAEIEIVDGIDRSAIHGHFVSAAVDMKDKLERARWDWGKHSANYLLPYRIRLHYLDVAARIAREEVLR